jgi:transcriptional regulator with XRE-family HTH domain
VSGKKAEPRNTVKGEGRIEFQVVAEAIQRVREKAGKSRGRLSRDLGKVRGYIGKIERHETLPDVATLLRIFEVCEVNPGETVNEIVAEVKRLRSAAKPRTED